MAEEKVYSPEVVNDAPFPEETGGVDYTATSGSTSETHSPEKTKDQPFPTRLIARETIGSAINTKSRKILAEFNFTVMGAISIGEYQNGISGDIRISSRGIVARNTSGDITVAIDGETGNAIFAGELRSGTLITGDIVVGNNTWIISGDPDRPSIKLFNSGVCSIIIGVR